MAENIDTLTLFNAGHRWIWRQAPVFAKRFGSTGIDGDARAVLRRGARPGTIVGTLISAAVATRALADADLDAQELAVNNLVRTGTPVAWQDDQAHTGTSLVIESFDTPAARSYASAGASIVAMVDFVCQVLDLTGGP